jgi:pimeloyl-ACP methyl ester carboxylesterase
MIRQGAGSPLVLFHGVLGGEGMWDRVVPLLAAHHDTIAPTALGHRGGRAATVRPAQIAHVVDDAERCLDDLNLSKAHLAGNSMGGWVALELARRGRALSVCALSPAGFWKPGVGRSNRAAEALRRTIQDTRRGRAVLPVLARFARFRRWAMRMNALHGDRLTPRELVARADDLLGCAAAADLLSTTEGLAPLDPVPCPITIAWSERDRILPLAAHAGRVHETVPGARFIVLNDVGHVPMFDSPEVVVRTILETIALAVRS